MIKEIITCGLGCRTHMKMSMLPDPRFRYCDSNREPALSEIFTFYARLHINHHPMQIISLLPAFIAHCEHGDSATSAKVCGRQFFA